MMFCIHENNNNEEYYNGIGRIPMKLLNLIYMNIIIVINIVTHFCKGTKQSLTCKILIQMSFFWQFYVNIVSESGIFVCLYSEM